MSSKKPIKSNEEIAKELEEKRTASKESVPEDPNKITDEMLAKIAAIVSRASGLPEQNRQTLFAKALDVFTSATQYMLRPTPIWLPRDDNTFSLVIELRLVKVKPPEQ